jgi:hypothetical protein
MSEQKKHSRDQADADLAVLRASSPKDFDGHTEFYRLTPLQRLAWLDEAVAFIGAAKSTNRAAAHDPEAAAKITRIRKGILLR